MNYDFNAIEEKWQEYWSDHGTFQAKNNSDKPKYYVLDMFPYPSGAGLHVGHPLGYIASDIYARYKRHMIRLVFRQSNMRFKPGNTLQLLPKLTLPVTASN